MKESLEKAIKVLAEKVTKDITAVQALQYTQAALNAAHALMTVEDNKNRNK